VQALFTKFDPHAFLENEKRQGLPAKAAKVAKGVTTLAGLAALAAPRASSQFCTASQARANVWSEPHGERAAIAKGDVAGGPRAWAEALARLDPATPPGDVPLRRWQQFIDDCGRFLDHGWAEKSNALGWRPLDLFGCDRERPWARIDRSGLLWLLDGRKLVALTAKTASIEAASGVRHTYYRAPIEAGRVVLAWELH